MLGSRVSAARACARVIAVLASLALPGAVLAMLAGLALPAAASAAAGTKVVSYHGYRLTVPAGWPVYRLAGHSAVCVRFNRHAVYLGQPSTGQRCPATTMGRTEAILIQPLGGASTTTQAVMTPAVAGADTAGGSVARIVDAARDVAVTATWHRDPAVIAHSLGVRSLTGLAARSRARPARYQASIAKAPRLTARTAAVAAAPGQVYTGTGFDVCSTPRLSAMSAWAGSYRAVAVYIGGANMACSQPNLTGAWVDAVSAAGWHLVPIYVGLQAPSNSCGCNAISPSGAARQGSAAARDAVAQAQARGLDPGNPIYFDMEAYSPTSANRSAVLTFLAAWTAQLHALGYKSGVYSSDGSGVADLVAAAGAGQSVPDDIWMANWNGEHTTADAVVPSSDWANHQRIHQYQGGHNETHGGVTLNVDGDYLDAATAAAGGAVTAAAVPQSTAAPGISGTAVTGQTLTERHGAWAGLPTAYSYQWEACATFAGCAPIPGATGPTLTLGPAELGHRIRVLEGAGNAIGSAAAVASTAVGPVLTAPGAGYWLFTAHGNVYSSARMAWYGSAVRARAGSLRGLAPSADGQGYWLVDRAGRVFAFGDAAHLPAVHPTRPVVGMVSAPGGGYWLFSARGNVYPSAGASWYGAPVHSGVSTFTGMARTADGRGYWLVDAAGRVFAYGDAAHLPAVHPTRPVVGIVSAPGGGYWLFTARGDVYARGGARRYGSPVHAGVSPFTGMASTADGRGYWLVDAAGRVFARGDAPHLPAPRAAHPVVGLAR